MKVKRSLNLTQHPRTVAQITNNVKEPTPDDKDIIKALLDFSTLPTRADVEEAAFRLANLAAEYPFTKAMIGGAPFLMSALERQLHLVGIEPTFAFSPRISSEVRNADGSVTKTSDFVHLGFVPGSGFMAEQTEV